MKTIRTAGFCLALMFFTGTVWSNSLVSPLTDKTVVIKKPANIKGTPAATADPEAGPAITTIEELNDWLVTNKRATWRYFDKLSKEDQQQILAAYQQNPDSAALTARVLHAWRQSRGH